MPTKPKIFIPEEGNNTLIDVLLEQYDDFDIYWYHWPQDGYVFWVEDYEPVIIVYKGDEICYLITRRHWSYKFYTADEDLKIPLEVLFDGEFHPPYPKTDENGEWFERKKEVLIPRDYQPKDIKDIEIPKKFRTGENHPTSFGRRVKDPVKVAKEIYEEYCQ